MPLSNILPVVVIFLVETVHQLGGGDGPEFWHTDVEAIAVAWRIARQCCFLDLHNLPVGVKHLLENDLDGELGVRRELRHCVVLFIKYGHVDMLITNVGDFERLFKQATAPLRQGDTAMQLVLDLLQVFCGLNGFSLFPLHLAICFSFKYELQASMFYYYAI